MELLQKNKEFWAFGYSVYKTRRLICELDIRNYDLTD